VSLTKSCALFLFQNFRKENICLFFRASIFPFLSIIRLPGVAGNSIYSYIKTDR